MKWLRRLLGRAQNSPASIEETVKHVTGLNIQSAREIGSVIEAHFAWKSRIQAVIEGSSSEILSVEVVSKDNQCILGKWIYGSGYQHYGDDTLFQGLRETHTHFHQCAGHVLALAQTGDKDQAQRSIQGAFSAASRVVIAKLTEMYQKALKS